MYCAPEVPAADTLQKAKAKFEVQSADALEKALRTSVDGWVGQIVQGKKEELFDQLLASKDKDKWESGAVEALVNPKYVQWSVRRLRQQVESYSVAVSPAETRDPFASDFRRRR